LTGCDVVEEEFTGSQLVQSAAQSGTIAWLLVQGAATNSSRGILGKAQYLQRVETMGGAPTVNTYPLVSEQAPWPTDAKIECTQEGEMLNVPYQCDYIFSYCGGDAPLSKPPYPTIVEDREVSQDGVSLPISNGARAVQSVFTRGVGTQNYYCQDDNGVYAWKLMEPRAWLHNYMEGSTRRMDKMVNGYHFFGSVGQPAAPGSPGTGGGAPGWALGSGCNVDHCAGHESDTFTGSLIRSASQAAGTIAWLLVGKSASSGTALGGASHLQRLATISGAVPSSVICDSTTVGKTYQMAYECDYFFSKPTWSPPLSWKFGVGAGWGFKWLGNSWGWGWGSPGWGWFA